MTPLTLHGWIGVALCVWMLVGIEIIGTQERRESARAFWAWWLAGTTLVVAWFGLG